MPKISSIKFIEDEDIVYDITVQDNNNLYASTKESKSSILVHNCSPLLIREAQLQICTHKYSGHKSVDDFLTLLHHQLGIMVKTFAFLKRTGIHIDTKNARKLVAENNVFDQTSETIKRSIIDTDEGKKANAILAKQQGLQTTTGMFSSQKAEVFNINKPGHVRKLFFDIMKLEPTKVGKSGEPSADKSFQAKYKDNPIVKLYGNHNKVKILKKNFADGLIKIINNDRDFAADGRLRPILGFLFVLTGRLCFTGDTPVTVLDERGTVPIKDMKPGDWVWSVNTSTMLPEPKRVTKAWKTGHKKVVEVKFKTPKDMRRGGKYTVKTVRCTPDHPFLLADGTWCEAQYLTKNDRIVSMERPLTDGHKNLLDSICVSVTHLEQKEDVYDITVEDNHNFFANGLCAHNSSKSPNSQNLPTRSDPNFEVHKGMVKAIKASFSVKHGRVMLGSDFSAHEVRMAGVISKDPGVRATFIKANEAIRKYRLAPEAFLEAAKKVLDTEGDIHISNVRFFFNQDVDKNHPLRYRIKAIVFGVLYGKLAKGLAKELGIEVEEAQSLIDVMFERWHYLKDWIDGVHKEGKETFMVRYPNKRVAHMWAYLHDDIWAERAMDRRSVNYPIQGFASDVGVTSIYCYKEWVYKNITRKGYYLDAQHINIVHDAGYSDVLYEHLPFAIYMTEHAMSTLPMDYYKNKFGYEISTPLGYGMEMGTNWASLNEWNYRPETLLDMVRDLGKNMDKPYDKVIADTKYMIKIRERELAADPYKMLIKSNNIAIVFDKLHMFREQEAA